MHNDTLQIAQALIRAGASLEVYDEDGTTARHIAMENNRIAEVDEIIRVISELNRRKIRC